MSHLNNRKLHSGVAVIRRELLFHLRLLSILLLSPQFLWSAPTPSVRISPDPLEGFRSSPVRAEAKAEGEIPRYLQWYFNGSLLLA